MSQWFLWGSNIFEILDSLYYEKILQKVYLVHSTESVTSEVNGMNFLVKKAFEERVKETTKKASKVIKRLPDEMKPRAKETLTEFTQELEQLYKFLVITDKDVEGLVVETRKVTLEEKNMETLKRICDILYNTYVKMGKKEAANEWKKKAEAIDQSGSRVNQVNTHL